MGSSFQVITAFWQLCLCLTDDLSPFALTVGFLSYQIIAIFAFWQLCLCLTDDLSPFPLTVGFLSYQIIAIFAFWQLCLCLPMIAVGFIEQFFFCLFRPLPSWPSNSWFLLVPDHHNLYHLTFVFLSFQIIAIFAFATTTSYSSVSSFTVPCPDEAKSVSIKLSYPFK